MSRARERELSIVVYGATGFTGKFVAETIGRQQGLPGLKPLRWAIAGRSKEKLQLLVRALREKGLVAPDAIITADNNDSRSLEEMASRADLVANCTGPYRFLGEQVVESCIRAGTDYIDLCGEPEFMDRVLLKFNDEAREKQVLIIHACAFDSVPADLGAIFTASLFQPPALCSSIESFLTIDTGGKGLAGHSTTFEAAVHGFGSVRDLSKIRRALQSKYPYDDKPWRAGPAPVAKAGPYYEPRVGRYCFRFPGSDASVVRSSQRQMILCGVVKAPVVLPRYAAYFTVPSAWWAAVVAGVGLVFTSLAKYEWGRSLLLSHTGPTEEQLAATRFSMTFFGRGYSQAAQRFDPEQPGTPLLEQKGTPCDKFVVTRVGGPEPGYVATPLIFVEVARCLLEERTILALQGGVFTPGAVFKDSTLIDRLRRVGIDFKVLEQ